MRKIKQALALGAAVGAVLAFASPAQAAEGSLKSACVLQGAAKVSPPMPFLGGIGTYRFDELLFTCVSLEVTKGTNVAAGILQLDVTSTGTYRNLVCGTATAKSTFNQVTGVAHTPLSGTAKTDTVAEWQAVAEKLDYAVDFVALHGILLWTDPDANGKALPPVAKTFDGNSTNGVLGGVVQGLPDSSKANVLPGACTKAFQVTAALLVDVPVPA